MYMICGHDRYGRVYELQGMHTYENALGIIMRAYQRFQSRGQFIHLYTTPILDI